MTLLTTIQFVIAFIVVLEDDFNIVIGSTDPYLAPGGPIRDINITSRTRT